MGKIQTPDWILKGNGKPAKEKKAKPSAASKKGSVGKGSGKKYKIKKCPQCGSDKIGVVLGMEEGKSSGEWECKKCKWTGKNVKDEEVSEDEFLEYMEKQEGKAE